MTPEKLAALNAVADVATTSLQRGTRDQHGTLARVSHLAALAAERLQSELSSGLDDEIVRDLLAMLREIQNEGHLGYLKHSGAETDYQKVGAKVRSRFQTPSGKWRKLAP